MLCVLHHVTWVGDGKRYPSSISRMLLEPAMASLLQLFRPGLHLREDATVPVMQ
jgi:hypothetical protein